MLKVGMTLRSGFLDLYCLKLDICKLNLNKFYIVLETYFKLSIYVEALASNL